MGSGARGKGSFGGGVKKRAAMDAAHSRLTGQKSAADLKPGDVMTLPQFDEEGFMLHDDNGVPQERGGWEVQEARQDTVGIQLIVKDPDYGRRRMTMDPTTPVKVSKSAPPAAPKWEARQEIPDGTSVRMTTPVKTTMTQDLRAMIKTGSSRKAKFVPQGSIKLRAGKEVYVRAVEYTNRKGETITSYEVSRTPAFNFTEPMTADLARKMLTSVPVVSSDPTPQPTPSTLAKQDTGGQPKFVSGLPGDHFAVRQGDGNYTIKSDDGTVVRAGVPFNEIGLFSTHLAPSPSTGTRFDYLQGMTDEQLLAHRKVLRQHAARTALDKELTHRGVPVPATKSARSPKRFSQKYKDLIDELDAIAPTQLMDEIGKMKHGSSSELTAQQKLNIINVLDAEVSAHGLLSTEHATHEHAPPGDRERIKKLQRQAKAMRKELSAPLVIAPRGEGTELGQVTRRSESGGTVYVKGTGGKIRVHDPEDLKPAVPSRPTPATSGKKASADTHRAIAASVKVSQTTVRGGTYNPGYTRERAFAVEVPGRAGATLFRSKAEAQKYATKERARLQRAADAGVFKGPTTPQKPKKDVPLSKAQRDLVMSPRQIARRAARAAKRGPG